VFLPSSVVFAVSDILEVVRLLLGEVTNQQWGGGGGSVLRSRVQRHFLCPPCGQEESRAPYRRGHASGFNKRQGGVETVQYLARPSLGIVTDQEASELAEAQANLNAGHSDFMSRNGTAGHGRSYVLMWPETLSFCNHLLPQCEVPRYCTIVRYFDRRERAVGVEGTLDKQIGGLTNAGGFVTNVNPSTAACTLAVPGKQWQRPLFLQLHSKEPRPPTSCFTIKTQLDCEFLTLRFVPFAPHPKQRGQLLQTRVQMRVAKLVAAVLTHIRLLRVLRPPYMLPSCGVETGIPELKVEFGYILVLVACWSR
jgi:hypothetical protein